MINPKRFLNGVLVGIFMLGGIFALHKILTTIPVAFADIVLPWSDPVQISDETIGSEGASVVVDSDHVVHAVWWNQNQMYHARRVNGEWLPAEPIGAGVLGPHALASDKSGNIHLVYVSGSGVYHRIYNGATWSSPIFIGDGTIQWPAITVDDSEVPHVVWLQLDSNNQYKLYYSVFGGSIWEVPDEVATSSLISLPQLAVDHQSIVHIVWSGGSSRNIEYVRGVYGSWSVPAPISDAFIPGGWPDIAVDTSNRIHVVWSHLLIDADIYHTYRDGADWSVPVKVAALSLSANRPSIDADAKGNVHLVWANPVGGGNSEIFYSTWGGSSWSSPAENISHNPLESAIPAIAIDRYGGVHVVWSNKTPENTYAVYYSLKEVIPPSPTPVIPDGWNLPVRYEGRDSYPTAAQFKSAFWTLVNAGFDHDIKHNSYIPFTGTLYKNNDCPNGALGIECYDEHRGVDFNAYTDPVTHANDYSVFAVTSGTVLYTSEYDSDHMCIGPDSVDKKGFGCVVIISHSQPNSQEEVIAVYAHLSEIYVAPGNPVTESTHIAKIGNTGWATGNHLHLVAMRQLSAGQQLATTDHKTSAKMSASDWKLLVATVGQMDAGIQAAPAGSPTPTPSAHYTTCSYDAPGTGTKYVWFDPFGWKGEGVDPYSLPDKKTASALNIDTKVYGCDQPSPYLWKYDVGAFQN